MPISLEELRRITEGDARTRGIAGYLYCDKCAYCLRTLPRVGVCPECGSFYDSRINSMKGIFTGREFSLPIGYAFGALVLLGYATTAVVGLYSAYDGGTLGIAIACGGVGLWYAYQTYHRLWRFVTGVMTVRAIERSRENEE